MIAVLATVGRNGELALGVGLRHGGNSVGIRVGGSGGIRVAMSDLEWGESSECGMARAIR